MEQVDYDRLIVDYLVGEITPADKKRLTDWLDESEENRACFNASRDVWLASSVLASADPEKTGASYQRMKNRMNGGRRKQFLNMMMRCAASVALFVIGGMSFCWMYQWRILNAEPDGQVYTINVPHGSRTEMLLPDGTKVWINAGSVLTYDRNYGVGNRNVKLVGEAYFDVKTNPEKPFTVFTTDFSVKAYGTQFNVKSYPEDKVAITTLEEGCIEVQEMKKRESMVSLTPNQSVAYYKRRTAKIAKKVIDPVTRDTVTEEVETVIEPRLKVYDGVNTRLLTSWKDSEWVLKSEKLENLAVLLERRYNIKVLFDNPDIRKIIFSATIRQETVEEILTAITATAPIKYVIDKGTVHLDYDTKRSLTYLRNFD